MGEVGYAMWIVYSFDVSRLHRYINRIRQQTSQHISKGIIRTTSQHSSLKEDLAVCGRVLRSESIDSQSKISLIYER